MPLQGVDRHLASVSGTCFGWPPRFPETDTKVARMIGVDREHIDNLIQNASLGDDSLTAGADT
jgi:hypothetical protein